MNQHAFIKYVIREDVKYGIRADIESAPTRFYKICRLNNGTLKIIFFIPNSRGNPLWLPVFGINSIIIALGDHKGRHYIVIVNITCTATFHVIIKSGTFLWNMRVNILIMNYDVYTMNVLLIIDKKRIFKNIVMKTYKYSQKSPWIVDKEYIPKNDLKNHSI